MTQHWFNDLLIHWQHKAVYCLWAKLVWTKLAISGQMGDLNTAAKVTFLPDHSLFLEYNDISGPALSMAGKGDGWSRFPQPSGTHRKSVHLMLYEALCHYQKTIQVCLFLISTHLFVISSKLHSFLWTHVFVISFPPAYKKNL